MSPESARRLTEAVAHWVRCHPEYRALALVGSWARGDPRPDSDLDLLVLADGNGHRQAGTAQLDSIDFQATGYFIAAQRTVRYGAVLSHHLSLCPRAEVELSLASLDWAATSTIDAGTLQVVRGGFRNVVDKDGLFRRLLAAVGQQPVLPG